MVSMLRLPDEYGGMLVPVNGYVSNNGSPYFQRAIPLALQSRFGKKLVRIRLHQKNGHFVVQCKRLWDGYSALFQAMQDDADLVPSEVKVAAVALLSEFGLQQGDGSKPLERPHNLDTCASFDPTPWLSPLENALQERFSKPTAVTNAVFQALQGSQPTLLSEAFDLYIDNHRRGRDGDFVKTSKAILDKLISIIGDVPIEALTRQHAKTYRDTRLSQGVKVTTVQRDVATLKAIMSSAAVELGLSLQNPFAKLTIIDNQPNRVDEELYAGRQPFSVEEHKTLIDAALLKNDAQRAIVIVLAFTGARLAEVVGLRRSDVDLETKSIKIQSHAARRLKNESSARVIPLLPMAFEALKTVLNAHESDFVFPTYCSEKKCNADSASATLNKWARKIVAGKTMHCFRHTMRDWLRAVECPESISKQIGGWSSAGDVSVGYGNGYNIEILRKWLKRAYS